MKKIIIGLAILVTFLTFCIRLPNDPGTESFYFNSFESAADIADWYGLQSSNLKDDVPANGGKKSVYVAGGCVIPHASLELKNGKKDSYFTLSCWGKNLMRGGIVLLRTAGDDSKEISVTVSDSTWTFYESSENLFCPANGKLLIEMNSGGIVPSGMLVDLLKIKRQ